MKRVPWVVVTWKLRTPGPGAATTPRQREGAAVFPGMPEAEAWMKARYEKGDHHIQGTYNVFNGDPTWVCGAPPGDWSESPHVVVAHEDLQ